MDVGCQFCGQVHVVDDAEIRLHVVHFRCSRCETLHFVTPGCVSRADALPPLGHSKAANNGASSDEASERANGVRLPRPVLGSPLDFDDLARAIPPLDVGADGFDSEAAIVRPRLPELARGKARWAIALAVPLAAVAFVGYATAVSFPNRAAALDRAAAPPSIGTAASPSIAAEPTSIGFDRSAPIAAPEPAPAEPAAAAYDRAAIAAQRCVLGGATPFAADLVVTIAPSGKVVRIALAPASIATTPRGRCLTAELRRIAVPPFQGPSIQLRRSIDLPGAAQPPP